MTAYCTCGRFKHGMHVDDDLCSVCARNLYGDEWVRRMHDRRILLCGYNAKQAEAGIGRG